MDIQESISNFNITKISDNEIYHEPEPTWGLIHTPEEVCQRYNMDLNEFLATI